MVNLRNFFVLFLNFYHEILSSLSNVNIVNIKFEVWDVFFNYITVSMILFVFLESLLQILIKLCVELTNLLNARKQGFILIRC
jgi:hypothetical protein